VRLSEAILEGFKKVNGKQCKGVYYRGSFDVPRAVCASGAVNLATLGHAYTSGRQSRRIRSQINAFHRAYGTNLVVLNDSGVDWRDIYGMAKAIERK
jgi:hypothetical protein